MIGQKMERGSRLKMFLQGFSKELRFFLIMEGTSFTIKNKESSSSHED